MHSPFIVLYDLIDRRVFAHKIGHRGDTYNTDRAPGFLPTQHLKHREHQDNVSDECRMKYKHPFRGCRHGIAFGDVICAVAG